MVEEVRTVPGDESPHRPPPDAMVTDLLEFLLCPCPASLGSLTTMSTVIVDIILGEVIAATVSRVIEEPY